MILSSGFDDASDPGLVGCSAGVWGVPGALLGSGCCSGVEDIARWLSFLVGYSPLSVARCVYQRLGSNPGFGALNDEP
jgi:hypothetical protein